MAENKTQETDASVAAFIDAVPDEGQRADAGFIVAMMERISGLPPKMWGPAIIGFGRYHYQYESGREGDMPRLAFSPRKGKTVVYINGGFPTHADIMARLGKFKNGVGCLYIKTLSDVDARALDELVRASLAYMDDKYPR